MALIETTKEEQIAGAERHLILCQLELDELDCRIRRLHMGLEAAEQKFAIAESRYSDLTQDDD